MTRNTCPPIPAFLTRLTPVERIFSLPKDHPVHLAAIEQRRKRERASTVPIRSTRKMHWTVYRVAAIGGGRTRIGKVTAPHELAALKAATRRWPDEVDPTRPKGGLAVLPKESRR